MEKNNSKKAIIALFVLVVLISIIGSWMVLNATESIDNASENQETSKVSQPQEIKELQTSGKVSFTVIKKEGEND